MSHNRCYASKNHEYRECCPFWSFWNFCPKHENAKIANNCHYPSSANNCQQFKSYWSSWIAGQLKTSHQSNNSYTAESYVQWRCTRSSRRTTPRAASSDSKPSARPRTMTVTWSCDGLCDGQCPWSYPPWQSRPGVNICRSRPFQHILFWLRRSVLLSCHQN